MGYKEMYTNILGELAEVFARTDRGQIEALKRMIVAAERIFFMGVGREGLMTRALAMRLTHFGKETHWCWDDTTPAVKKDDLFIATSGSGEIGHIHYTVCEVKKTGAKVALVTGVPGRKTGKIADHILFVPASVYKGDDQVVPSTQPMGNLFEQSLLILFDMIIMELAADEGKTFREMAERHRNFE